VTTNRTVEPLEVAVDDPDQVVEVFAAGECERAERLGFVGFAIADKGPDLWLVTLVQGACAKVTVEAGMVDGEQGTPAHGDGRELAEIGHEVRVRVGAQAAAFGQFLAKVVQVLFIESAFEKSARIDSRSGVALDINEVAGELVGAGAEEMVKGDFVEGSGG